MGWLALAYALAAPAPVTPTGAGWTQTGRIVDRPDVHVGVRPALDVDREGDFAIGFTLQVTTRAL
jgi:hypothetical protein